MDDSIGRKREEGLRSIPLYSITSRDIGGRALGTAPRVVVSFQREGTGSASSGKAIRAFRILVLSVLVGTTFPLTPAYATSSTFYVALNGSDAGCAAGTSAAPFATIQHGIDCASDGDAIMVGEGKFTGFVLGKDLSIAGVSKTKTIIHDGVVVTDSAVATISQVKVRRGAVADALVSNSGNLKLTKSAVIGTLLSSRFPSQGIENFGTLLLSRSTVTRNHLYDGCGAGIVTYGSLTVKRSKIIRNDAENCGAGIEVLGPTSIIRSTIARNFADFGGGGVDNLFDGCCVTISGSKIYGNSSNGGGSGVYSRYGPMTIVNSQIYGNRDDYNGGGVSNQYGSLDVISTRIFSNDGSLGGGIFNLQGSVSLTSSEVSMNTANDGGGIYNQAGTISISSDSSIHDNVPNDCVGC